MDGTPKKANGAGGLPVPSPDLHTVAIIGMGPSVNDFMSDFISQDQKFTATGDRLEFDEVWCINLAARGMRCDKVFWGDDLKKEYEVHKDAINDINRLGVPVMTTTAYPELVPKSQEFPIKEMAQLSLEIFGKIYLNNSVAYAIAYAMVRGVKRILLYGCDFSYPQRQYAEPGQGCVEAWLTAFNLRNGILVLPPNTSIYGMASGDQLYGYSEDRVIDLGDGREISHQVPENLNIQRRVAELLTDGAEKNGKEIDLLSQRLKMLERTSAKAALESRIHSLSVEETEQITREIDTVEGAGYIPEDTSPGGNTDGRPRLSSA